MSGGSRTADAGRLAVGTLTILPVSSPRQVDGRTAARAMLLAPLVGLALAALVAGPLALVTGGLIPTALEGFRVPTLLLATLAIAALALLTRGLHLDGLADTADGLGSGRPAVEALAVMRRPDIGPFGVAALVLTLLLQIFALSVLLQRGEGPPALTAALVTSRALLPVVCTRGFPPARADGLGRMVAGTVGRGQAGAASAVALVAVLGCAYRLTPPTGDLTAMAGLLGAAVLGAATGLGVVVHARNRLHGVTGDVYGAGVEVALTTVLVLFACLP